jgi:hypothetical protein
MFPVSFRGIDDVAFTQQNIGLNDKILTYVYFGHSHLSPFLVAHSREVGWLLNGETFEMGLKHGGLRSCAISQFDLTDWN